MTDSSKFSIEVPGGAKSLFASLGGGIVGALVGAGFQHPILGFLGGGSVVGNTVRTAVGAETKSGATANVARMVSGIAGAILYPTSPIIGFVLGGACADVLLSGHGTGIVLSVDKDKKEEVVGIVEEKVNSYYLLARAA